MILRPALLSLMLLASAPVLADVSPQSVDAARAAFRAFERQAPPGASLAQLPRLSDPAGRAMLAPIFDTKALLAGRPAAGESMGPGAVDELMQWIQLASQTMRNYLTVVQNSPDPAAMQGELRQELVLGTTFLYRGQASLVQALQAAGRFPAADDPTLTPRQREGLRRMQLGLGQVIEGVLRMLAEPGFTPEDRRSLAGTLAADLPLLRPGLTDETRLRLAAEVSRLQAKEREPAVAASFDQVQQALTAAP